MSKTAIRVSLCVGLVLGLQSAAAQRRVDAPEYEQPERGDIVLGGNSLHRSVTCTADQAVYIQGQRNQVEVAGPCRFVRIQGNDNHMFEHGRAPVYVEGNDNLVEVTDPDTPFSERGEHNRFERRGTR